MAKKEIYERKFKKNYWCTLIINIFVDFCFTNGNLIIKINL